MTISVVWLRKLANTEELVLACDSRLSGYGRWDCCPKLVALPRNDGAICFAGPTAYAYPIIIQAVSAITQHPRLLNRAMDLEDLKGHLLRVVNSMVMLIQDLPRGEEHPETTFILAGWSWKRSKFLAWLLHFDVQLRKFTFRPAARWGGGNEDKFLVFTGDYEDEFRTRLVDLLRGRDRLAQGGFDMEPLEVLRDMLREQSFDLIGGAPQVMKVYRHINCTPYAVFWPTKKSNRVSLLGRPLLEYESSQYMVLDPDTLETTKHVDLV